MSKLPVPPKRRKRATGPTSEAGKERASQNATKHGATRAITPTLRQSLQMDDIVDLLTSENASEEERSWARQFAEAHVAVENTRHNRIRLMSFALIDPDYAREFGAPGGKNIFPERPLSEKIRTGELAVFIEKEFALPDPNMAAKLVPGLLGGIDTVLGVDQYEDRALGKRRKAIRHLIAPGKPPA